MSAFRRMMSYLGLVDDDEYDDYEPYDEPQPAAVARPARPVGAEPAEPSSGAVRTLQREPVEAQAGVTVTPVARSPVIRPMVAAPSSKPHTIAPTSFQDAQEIGDRFREGVPVIVNLQAADRDLMRRIIDFSSGLTYGLGGEMERTADRVYLLTPAARS